MEQYGLILILISWDYWQFWRNTEDKDVIRFLKLFMKLASLNKKTRKT